MHRCGSWNSWHKPEKNAWKSKTNLDDNRSGRHWWQRKYLLEALFCLLKYIIFVWKWIVKSANNSVLHPVVLRNRLLFKSMISTRRKQDFRHTTFFEWTYTSGRYGFWIFSPTANKFWKIAWSNKTAWKKRRTYICLRVLPIIERQCLLNNNLMLFCL